MSTEHRPGQPLVVLAAGRARRYGGVKPLAPVGPGGEAVIDLLASDAVSAGFSSIVLVISPSTGPAIRYHVERTWPSALDVRFAVQEAPLGTVHALLSAADQVSPERSFGVANADDLYGQAALTQLARYVGADDTAHCLVGFRLRNALIGDSPVTRGICRVDQGGLLTGIDERRQVFALGDDRFVSKDGREPAELDGDALVSMNLWGFRPGIWVALEEAMAEAGQASEEAEVLLPEMVGEVVAGRRSVPGSSQFRVLATDGRCIGVTHPDDLHLVQSELATQVGRGDRPAQLWSGLER